MIAETGLQTRTQIAGTKSETPTVFILIAENPASWQRPLAQQLQK